LGSYSKGTKTFWVPTGAMPFLGVNHMTTHQNVLGHPFAGPIERMAHRLGSAARSKTNGRSRSAEEQRATLSHRELAFPKGYEGGTTPNRTHCMVAEHGSEPRLCRWQVGDDIKEEHGRIATAKLIAHGARREEPLTVMKHGNS